MPYNADNTGVTALTAVTYTAGTIPTTTQVTAFRAQRYAEINGVLKARGYAVPATGVNDVAMLAYYENIGAACLAEQARYQGNVEQPRVKQWHEEYMAFLNRLRRGRGLAERAAAEPEADPFDLLAAHLERYLDLDKLLAICGLPR